MGLIPEERSPDRCPHRSVDGGKSYRQHEELPQSTPQAVYLMNRRFSDEELYNVRNRIPVRHVIDTLLAIPSETIHGIFRFRCPLCASCHTAINPETNLSRCFDCKKNFNTIDLCMLVRRTDFVQSVKFLLGHKSRLAVDGARTLSLSHRNHIESLREESKNPVALGDILAKLTCLRVRTGRSGRQPGA